MNKSNIDKSLRKKNKNNTTDFQKLCAISKDHSKRNQTLEKMIKTNKESNHLLEIGSNIEEPLRTKFNVIFEKIVKIMEKFGRIILSWRSKNTKAYL